MPRKLPDDWKRRQYEPEHRAKICCRAGRARTHQDGTTIITQDGRKQNGSLLYTLLPIQISIQQFYEQQLAKLDAECEQERIRKRLEAFQQAQQKNACPPA